jgi:hypothetical protein
VDTQTTRTPNAVASSLWDMGFPFPTSSDFRRILHAPDGWVKQHFVQTAAR